MVVFFIGWWIIYFIVFQSQRSSWEWHIPDMDICCICNELAPKGKDSNDLTSKGTAGVNRASVERGDELRVTEGQRVHKTCYRNYCKPQNVARDAANKQITVQPRSDLRSVKAQFNFQEHCLFCGQSAKYDKKRRSADIFPVRTEEFKHVILDICNKRNDEWSQTVSGRLA